MTDDAQNVFNRNVMLALLELRDLLAGISNPHEKRVVLGGLNERLDFLSKMVTGVDVNDPRMKDKAEPLEIETKCFIAQIISGKACTHPRKHEDARGEVVKSYE